MKVGVNAETFSPFFAMRELQEDYWGYRLWINRKKSCRRSKSFWNEGYGIQQKPGKKDPNFRILEYASIDDILANSDIVTMHCPLNEDSKYMCNKEFFKKMKKMPYSLTHHEETQQMKKLWLGHLTMTLLLMQQQMQFQKNLWKG